MAHRTESRGPFGPELLHGGAAPSLRKTVTGCVWRIAEFAATDCRVLSKHANRTELSGQEVERGGVGCTQLTWEVYFDVMVPLLIQLKAGLAEMEEGYAGKGFESRLWYRQLV